MSMFRFCIARTLKQINSILLNVNDSKLYRVRENLAIHPMDTLTVIVSFEDRVGFLNGNNTKSQYYENACLINDIFTKIGRAHV